jgi:hypothetical protein
MNEIFRRRVHARNKALKSAIAEFQPIRAAKCIGTQYIAPILSVAFKFVPTWMAKAEKASRLIFAAGYGEFYR